MILFEPEPPPKRRIGVPEALYAERVEMWNERTMKPAGWIRRPIPYDIQGKPCEPDVWNQLKEASTVAQVRDACRTSKIWLDPDRSGKLVGGGTTKPRAAVSRSGGVSLP